MMVMHRSWKNLPQFSLANKLSVRLAAADVGYRPTIDLLSQSHSTDEEMFSAASFSGLVEFSTSFSARPQISHVVFDFDGTIAWLKHGWPDIMARLLLPYFSTQSDETLRH